MHIYYYGPLVPISHVPIYRQARLTMWIIRLYSQRYIKRTIHVAHVFSDIYIKTWQYRSLCPPWFCSGIVTSPPNYGHSLVIWRPVWDRDTWQLSRMITFQFWVIFYTLWCYTPFFIRVEVGVLVVKPRLAVVLVVIYLVLSLVWEIDWILWFVRAPNKNIFLPPVHCANYL